MDISIADSNLPVALDDAARIRAALTRATLFASLPTAALDDLAQRVTLRKVASGATVLSQDDPGEAMFVIVSGRVKVVIFGENGREVTLSLLRPCEAFGEHGAVGHHHHHRLSVLML